MGVGPWSLRAPKCERPKPTVVEPMGTEVRTCCWWTQWNWGEDQLLVEPRGLGPGPAAGGPKGAGRPVCLLIMDPTEMWDQCFPADGSNEATIPSKHDLNCERFIPQCK